ncbi:baseplate J/gp47 family protein [Acetobacter estunensis]|uniref:baseplate J/gp47 family protein n=1 Tax=Acetobacter estunensis TaxID=104097 RepID=UPI001C2CDBAB|nr:baseplate J/gp47 family protein [Acetobacter estunensis]MBV1835664.1 baseplate J/gp47 family protein [Acetobacter estunensis]MBV1836075.1 baseplate J/gp47 family protein [Acetobacter estunensis]
MAYARPTLTELRQQALQDVQNGGIPGVTKLLRFSVLYVLSMVLAGLTHLTYGYLDWIAKQAVPWTATDEWLEAWGALKSVYRKAATTSSGQIAFPVSGNADIPVGTEIVADGVAVVTTSDSVISNGIATVSCAAQSAGANGNIAAGAIATLSSPVPGVQTSGTVTVAFTGGADEEADEDLRTRIMAAYAKGGESGDEADYIGWAEDVAGVTRAWVNPLGAGAGSVVVYVMFDTVRAADGGFPQGADGAATAEMRYTTAAGDQLLVANALYDVRPVTALVVVCSPIAQPVSFVIADLGDDNTSDNQAAITDALTDMFRRLSAPGGTIHPNYWNEALAAIGLSTFNVTSPSAPVVADNVGSMPILGTVSFSA